MSKNLLWWVSWHPMTMKKYAEHHYDENQTKYFDDKDKADKFEREIRKIMPDGRWVHTDSGFVWKHHYPDVEVE